MEVRYNFVFDIIMNKETKIFSLGMSWASGHLVKSINPTTSMLDSLKASILGLGNANCEIIYQQCDLKREISERRRRRRKRSKNKRK